MSIVLIGFSMEPGPNSYLVFPNLSPTADYYPSRVEGLEAGVHVFTHEERVAIGSLGEWVRMLRLRTDPQLPADPHYTLVNFEWAPEPGEVWWFGPVACGRIAVDLEAPPPRPCNRGFLDVYLRLRSFFARAAIVALQRGSDA